MTDGTTDVDIVSFLEQHPLSEVLPAEVRRALAEPAEVQSLAAGEVLVEQGGPGDAGYLVVSGRLRVTVDGVLIGTIGPGETVGEMALLTGEPRSATVQARRPTTVIRIDADSFLRVLAEHPQTHRALSRVLVERLDRTLTGRTMIPAFATIVAVAGPDDDQIDGLLERMAAIIGSMGVKVGRSPRIVGEDLSALPALEAENDVVLVASSLAGLAANHAWYDRLVVVIDGPGATVTAANTAPPPVPAEATDIVVVHGDDVRLPTGTRRLLGDRLDIDHHHVRRTSERDLARLARRLLGRERVLVLGGGGARGLAHLGTYQALAESGIDIDAVVGVSAGAIFGAPVALDWSPDEAARRTSAGLTSAGRLIDYTVPMVALSSGRRITEGLQTTFGLDVDLEDLWCPLTALSADLTTLSLRLQQRGRLWRALRASVAVPGVFPPLVDGDAVLVDGGTVDNLPVGPARRLYPGATIISSDVGRRIDSMTFDLPDGGIVGGWTSLWHRVGRRRRTTNVLGLLYRLTALGGGATDPEVGDIHIEHEVTGIGMFDFARSRHAVEAGYRATMARLESVDLHRL